MPTILVTGGAGFIGSHVTKALMDRKDEVIIVDNFNAYYDPQLKEDRINKFLKGYSPKLYRASINNIDELRKVFAENKIDKICHLAAQAGVRYSLENPSAYIQSNIVGTHNLLELAKEFGVKDFVFASSSSVYGGNTKVPFAEKDPVEQPISLYAATKRSNELEVYTYHHLFGLNAIGLRFFTVYGPWGRPDMALFKFIKAIIAEHAIDVYNNGKMQRDFTYVDDIVAGVLAAIDNCKDYEIINLGNNKPVDLEYFIKLIEESIGKEAIKNYLPLQPGDVVATYADIKKAHKILNWKPKMEIEQGIKECIHWYKDYYKID